ncbi:AAA family ATPase [Microvirga sp. RSM25]|uniref:AAA family ATPase n=1 Tax=Microvirga sp. RSM25 TaxID=3273802 RepID=UPI00384F75CA
MTSLYLNHLELRNFRCFKACSLELHPELTVLVAENGSGKTALLDAAALVLSPFVNVMTAADQYKKVGSGRCST